MTQGPDSRGGVTGPQADLLRLAFGAQADLLRLAFGAQAAQLVYVAAKLGLADLLKDSPLATDDLAAEAGVDAALLRRSLRGLVSLGVVAGAAGNRFALTEVGQYLRSDRPDSVQPRAIFNTEVARAALGRAPPHHPFGQVRG